jgi:hypothetical protein
MRFAPHSRNSHPNNVGGRSAFLRSRSRITSVARRVEWLSSSAVHQQRCDAPRRRWTLGDAFVSKFELHPGDDVFAVGYPYGIEANDFGFPILRTGHIASFPLAPAKDVKALLVDFAVFGGNSGGPVYVNYLGRFYGGTYHLDQFARGIVGLVSKQAVHPKTQERLGVAGVVPSQLILEAVALLPVRSDSELR